MGACLFQTQVKSEMHNIFSYKTAQWGHTEISLNFNGMRISIIHRDDRKNIVHVPFNIYYTCPKGPQGDQLPHLRSMRSHHAQSFQDLVGKKVYNVGPPKAFQDNSWCQRPLHPGEKYYQDNNVSKLSGSPNQAVAHDFHLLFPKRKDQGLQQFHMKAAIAASAFHSIVSSLGKSLGGC